MIQSHEEVRSCRPGASAARSGLPRSKAQSANPRSIHLKLRASQAVSVTVSAVPSALHHHTPHKRGVTRRNQPPPAHNRASKHAALLYLNKPLGDKRSCQYHSLSASVARLAYRNEGQIACVATCKLCERRRTYRQKDESRPYPSIDTSRTSPPKYCAYSRDTGRPSKSRLCQTQAADARSTSN